VKAAHPKLNKSKVEKLAMVDFAKWESIGLIKWIKDQKEQVKVETVNIPVKDLPDATTEYFANNNITVKRQPKSKEFSSESSRKKYGY
jgi:chaperonin GroEL (HSP60 family)